MLRPVLTLDGGDITMGTLFHTVAREHDFELQLMQRLGYDATCETLTPTCGDGSELLCDALPPNCPGDLVLAVED